MLKVKDLLNSKKNNKDYIISPYSTIAYAIKKMTKENLKALAVVDDNKIVGVIEEDIFLKKLYEDSTIDVNQPIYNIMEMKVLYVSNEFTLEECLALMANKKIFFLPVIENDKLLDMISLHEISANLVEDKEFIIANLSHYISGNLVFNTTTALPEYVPEKILDTSTFKRKYCENQA